MSRLHPSPLPPPNPQIPIYLDTGDKRVQAEPDDIPDYTCPTCEISSRDQPIHCISHSAHASPSPPSYRSVISPNPSPGRLAVPSLNIITSQHDARPQPPRPALQFDPEGRPHLRFRRNAFSPLSPSVANRNNIDWSRKSHIGLGIPDAQFNPDASPITPGTVEKQGEERTKDPQDASNFAQRIEQKLWKYSASGNVVKRWLIEIISWSLSALCMAGIIGMLFYYKNERIPKWPLGLTLNAYISVLSKIASAALLLPVSEALGQLKWSWFQGDNSKKMWDFEIFDNASRGPWGSLLLLVRTKGRSLAALGAAVTLFALALDPFFQQVVEYPERWRLQKGTGSMPTAVGYKPYKSGKEYQYGGENLELDQKMLGVVQNYFYDAGTPPVTFGKGVRAEVPLGCPSSNCTWPAYETFGMCNECVDVADRLEFRCVNTTMDWVQVPELDEEMTRIFPNGTACGWWLNAEEPIFMTGYNTDVDTPHAGEVLMMRAQPIYDVMSRMQIPGYEARLNNSRNPLAHVFIASGGSMEEVLRNSTPIAHECILSWCSKTMYSTYSEGGYTEEIRHTNINTTVGPSVWQTRDLLNEQNEVQGVEYLYLEDVYVEGESGRMYHVDNYTHTLTLSIFDDIYPSSYTIINSTDNADARLRYKQYAYAPLLRSMVYNPYMYDNITEHLENMANAVTNLMRSAPILTEEIQGSAFEQESFVDVRWPWLALPLSLLALTFLFLISTVIRSSIEQDTVGVWKTSAIATLLYGLPDEMQKKITSSKQVGTPRAKAKEIKLKWLPKSGWRFSGNVLSPSTVKARQTMSSTTSGNSGASLSPPSQHLSTTTLIATPSLKSPISTPSFGTISQAPSVKSYSPSVKSLSPSVHSFSSSPTLECPSRSSSLKSPPTPPLKTTTISPPVSPFEPSFPTPPLGSCSPSPPFAFHNHPSPLASNPSLPLESPRNTQTYYEANPHAYYQAHPPAQPQVSSEENPQRNHQASPPPTNAQRSYQASPPPISAQRNCRASPLPLNAQSIHQAGPPAGSPPPIIPFVRSHARRPSKPRYPTPPPGWI